MGLTDQQVEMNMYIGGGLVGTILVVLLVLYLVR
jgi:hypothetical protein